MLHRRLARRSFVFLLTVACGVAWVGPNTISLAEVAESSGADSPGGEAAAPSWVAGEEVVGLRDRWGVTVKGAVPGKFVSTVHSGPVNFQAADGSWQPIDLTLTTAKSGLRPKANDLVPVMGLIGSSSSLVEMTFAPGERLQFGLAGALPVLGVAHGSSVVYPSILNGVDARFDMRTAGVKETLVLHSADAPTTYDFPLQLDGLTAEPSGDGSISLRDNAGQLTAVIPAGYMTDSYRHPRSGEPNRSNDVAYQLLAGDGGGTVLHVSISSAWLRDPARVFPVEVDPSVLSATYYDDADDAYVQSTGGYSSTDTVLKSGTFDGNDKSRSFMHFAAVNTFDGRQIDSATFAARNTWSYSCVERQVNVFAVASSWSGSNTMNWPGPSLRSPAVASATVAKGYNSSCPEGGVTFDVTTAVTNWANNSWQNYGLALVAASESDPYGWKKWASADASPGSTTYDPRITVNWTNSAPARVGTLSTTPNDCQFNCTAVTRTKDSTPILRGTTTDPDAQLLRYDFEIYPGLLSTVDGSGNATPGTVTRLQAGSVSNLSSGTTANWTVPTVLANGDYSFRVRAYDGELFSVWSSGWSKFTVDGSSPQAPTVTSGSHPVPTSYYNASTISAAWPLATAPPSGVNGYTTVLDTIPGTDPGVSAPAPATSGTFPNKDDNCWYLHARAQSNVGTWGPVSERKMCVDATLPNAPTSFYSTSHAVNGPSNSTVISVAGGGATDPYVNGSRSDIAGYSVAFNNSASTVADAVLDIAGTSLTGSSAALADGTWYAHVRALDFAGNASSDVVSGPYLIDTIKPTATTATSAQATSGSWTPNSAVTFNWPVPVDISGISGYAVALDQAPVTLPPATNSTTFTSWTYSGLADGTYYFHLRPVDKAGNWADQASHFTLLVDSTAPPMPTVASNTHPNESQWTSDDAASLTFSATDVSAGNPGSAITGLSYTLNQTSDTVPDTVLETSAASGSASYTGLPEGISYFHVRARNGSGLFGDPYHYKIRVDKSAPNVAPTVTSSSHAVNQPSNNPLLHLSWALAPGSDAGSGIVGYSVAINNSATTAADSVQDQTAKTYSHTMTADGNYYFHIRAIDALGFVAPDTVFGPYKFDLTNPDLPIITSTTHAENVWTPNSTGTFNLASADTSGITGFSVLVDQTSTTVPPTNVTPASSPYTTTGLADGIHYVHARARDTAGNWGDNSLYTVLVDTTGPITPSITSSTHPTQAQWSQNNNPGFSFAVSDVSGIIGWSYLLDQDPNTVPDLITELGAVTTGVAAFTELAEGVHYFHARAINGSGLPGATATYEIRVDRTVPTAPTLVSLTHEPDVITNHRIVTVDWTEAPALDALSGLAGYSVALNTDPTILADASIDQQPTTFTTSTLADGIYWLHVRGIDNVGIATDDITFGPIVIDASHGLPYPVQDVAAEALDRAATLSWIAADDNGSALLGYEITVSPSGRLVNVVPGATSTTIGDLENGVPYTFAIRARNANGLGDVLDDTLATVPKGAPGTVSELTLEEVGTGQVGVTWAAPELNGNPDLTYLVTLEPGGHSQEVAWLSSPGDDETASDVPFTTEALFTGLAAGTYTATVVANGVDVPVGAAAVSAPITIGGGLPGAPTGLVITPGDGELALAWAPAPDNGSPIEQYEIVQVATGESQFVDADMTSGTVTGLANGTTYTFDVFAINAAGRSLSRVNGSGTPADSGIAQAVDPTTPSRVTATAGATFNAVVRWDPPQVSTGSGYLVRTHRGDGAVLRTDPATGTQVTLTGLSGSVTGCQGVYFTVAASAAGQALRYSNPSNRVLPFGVPSAPTSAALARVPDGLRATFVTPSTNGCDPIADYRVQVYDSVSGYSQEVTAKGSPVVIESGVTLGRSYSVTIKARNRAGRGPASAATGTVKWAQAPLAPTSVTATENTYRTIRVDWNPSATRGQEVSRYRITAEPGGVSTTTTGTGPIILDVAKPGDYTVRVMAESGVGNSATMRSREVSLANSPAMPQRVTAELDSEAGKILVRWDRAASNNAAITSYTVSRTPGDETTVRTVAGTASSYRFGGLSASTCYTFRVYAHNRKGAGPQSSATSPCIRPTGASKAPTHPSGGTDSTQSVRTKIMKTAELLEQRKEREWGAEDCNYFTGRLGGGTSAEGCNDSEVTPFPGPASTEKNVWCSEFVRWIYKHEGVNIASAPGKPGTGITAAAGSSRPWAEARGLFHPAGDGYKPKPGDAIVWATYDSKGGYVKGHVGLVRKIMPNGTLHTVEGNSSDAVRLKERALVNGTYPHERGPFRGYASPVDAAGKAVR